MDRREHWNTVYANKTDAELSWFQASPGLSLEMIRRLRPRPASAIDIGAGQSALAGALLDEGVAEVAALDVSAAALERAKARLGERAARVRWIVADVAAEPAPDLGTFDLWHDRAAFHFLVDEGDRRRYAALAAAAVRPGGHLLIATFGPGGPEKCSGLPVRRYDAASLASDFAGAFRPVEARGDVHATPWGKGQEFVYVLMRRRPATCVATALVAGRHWYK